LPPVVAWAAASGATPPDAWILFAIIFLWTPPHFWALALYREGDYARAGVPMMPNVAGETSTKRQIFGYAVILAIGGVAPFATGLGGLVYLAISSAFGAGFLLLAWRVLRSPPQSKEAPKQLFAFSILYLFALFAALLIEDLFALYAAWSA
jgi:protoheme IX farnesyltransferase